MRIFNRMAGWSLVVFVLTVGWWFRSRTHMDVVLYKPVVGEDVLDSAQFWGCDGKWMYIRTVLKPAPQTANRTGRVLSWQSVPCDVDARPPGAPGIEWPSFTHYEGPMTFGSSRGSQYVAFVPVWPLAIASCVLPALWVLLHTGRRTTAKGAGFTPTVTGPGTVSPYAGAAGVLPPA